MKILIAYDGSPTAKLAIEDLEFAGLPQEGVEARILSVGEFVFPIDTMFNATPGIPLVSFTLEKAQELTTYAMDSAEMMAHEAEVEIRRMFPKWQVERFARLNSPATAILEVATSWEADLIVMGSHGRSTLGRLLMGSVSLRVMSEAPCSVRVVKRKPRRKELTLLLPFDGSEGARTALREMVHRCWPNDTLVHVLTIADVELLGSLDYVALFGEETFANGADHQTRLEHMMHAVEHELRKRFHSVTSSMVIGSPVPYIIETAERVDADTIFVGSRGLSRFQRLLLGSVAHGVTANAKSTVEIVRARKT